MQAEQRLSRGRNQASPTKHRALISAGRRNGFACQAQAIGFEALGQRRRSPQPLLLG